MVSCGFPFIFIRCFGCPAAGTWAEFGYYLPFIALLQVGWACAQISHLALIGHLTSSESEKMELVSYRYASRYSFLYRAMHYRACKARSCDRMLSVCLSVTLVDQDPVYWNLEILETNCTAS